MLVTPGNLSEVCATIREAKDRGIDTETTGLEETDLPFACIIAVEGEVFYFDDRSCPGFWSAPDFVSLFHEEHCTWHLQNAKFDMRMLESKGLPPLRNVNDIAVQARIQRNDHLAYSLDAQAKRAGMEKKGDMIAKYIKDNNCHEMRTDYFGVEYKALRFDQVPLELMQEYAEEDARITLELAKLYAEKFDDDDRKVWEMERALTPVLYKMERRGVRVDTKYTMQALYHEQSIVDGHKERFKEHTGVDYVDSAKSMQKVLSFTLPLTEKGSPSLTDDVIGDMLKRGVSEKDQILLGIVREVRHYEKRISTYYKPFLSLMDNNSYLHTNMKQAGTRTGRMSSSEPNLQQVPKEEDSTDTYVVRGCLTPSPGHIFVSIDYAQQEYRMMAAYAKENTIIQRVMAGEDFHQVTADMFGVTRKIAKTLNFMILYGGGDQKLADMLGLHLTEARRLKLKYFLALPRVELFIDAVIRTGRTRGYVRNWLGRKLYADREFCYALPNHLIQGGGADVVKAAMVQIDKELPDIKMILQVHDQLVFDITPSQLHHVPRLKEIMENVWEKEGMKLEVDVSWSNKSLAERDMKKGIPSADQYGSIQSI